MRSLFLFENIGHPPVESWFMVDANYLSIFGNFNRMGFLEVGEVRPRGGTVFPLATQLPANGQTPQVGPAVGAHNFPISKFNCRVCASVVDNFIQKDILMPTGAALGVQWLCNHISGQLGLVAIVEMNNVRSGVLDRVGIGEPNRGAIPVMLARGNASFDHCSATGKHDLGTEVIITHFWRDLSITVVRVKGSVLSK